MAPRPACLLSIQVSGPMPGASVLVRSRFFHGSSLACVALDVSLPPLKVQSSRPFPLRPSGGVCPVHLDWGHPWISKPSALKGGLCSAHRVSYLASRVSAHTLKCIQNRAGSEAGQKDVLPKSEAAEVREGSALSRKLGVVRRATGISCDDRIAILEERRAEPERKRLGLVEERSKVVSEKTSQDR